MTWNIGPIEGRDFDQLAGRARGTFDALPHDTTDVDRKQLEATITTVGDLIASGGWGDGPYKLTLTGHSGFGVQTPSSLVIHLDGAPMPASRFDRETDGHGDMDRAAASEPAGAGAGGGGGPGIRDGG